MQTAEENLLPAVKASVVEAGHRLCEIVNEEHKEEPSEYISKVGWGPSDGKVKGTEAMMIYGSEKIRFL